ncbi:hypothetical protein V8F33_006515 [Rhypophila sp. PSN 637]
METSRQDATSDLGSLISTARQAAESVINKLVQDYDTTISNLEETVQQLEKERQNRQRAKAKGDQLREELKEYEEAVLELKSKIAAHDETSLRRYPTSTEDTQVKIAERYKEIEELNVKRRKALRNASKRIFLTHDPSRPLLFRDGTPANVAAHEIPSRRGAHQLTPSSPLAPFAPPRPEAVHESNQSKTSVEDPDQTPAEPTRQQQQQPRPSAPSSPQIGLRRTRSSVKRRREDDGHGQPQPEPPASSSKRRKGAAAPAHSSTGSEHSDLTISYEKVSRHAGTEKGCTIWERGGKFYIVRCLEHGTYFDTGNPDKKAFKHLIRHHGLKKAGIRDLEANRFLFRVECSEEERQANNTVVTEHTKSLQDARETGQREKREKTTRAPEESEQDDEADILGDDHIAETEAETGSLFGPDGGDEDEDPEDFRSDEQQLVEEEEVRYLQRSLQAPTAGRRAVQPNGFDQNPSTAHTRRPSATGPEPGNPDLPP